MVDNKAHTTRSDITTSTMSSEGITRRAVENSTRKVTDFQLLRVIGTGTFGKVYLALLKGQPMALKALKKTHVIELRQVDHIKHEKLVLAQIFFPFIVNL